MGRIHVRNGRRTNTYLQFNCKSNNNNHYYVITIREQRQCTEISQLIVKTIIIIKQNIFLKCVVEESFLHKAGHLHFPGTELKLSYLMMGVTSGHSDGHVTLV